MLFFNFAFVLSQIYYLHPDHLGSTSAVTDQQNRVTEILDYDPFGAIRLDKQSGEHQEKRKFIGQEHDATGLDYLNARYYDSKTGRFISQDPLFWSSPEAFLFDPQQQNSYGYSRNNPIRFLDPLGLSTAMYNPVPAGGWKIGQKMGEFNGVSAYYNGIGSASTAFSCVEFAKRYQSQVNGIAGIGPVGDAKTMWNMTQTINERLSAAGSSSYFEKRENNTSYSLPKEGDLLFWTEGRYGHVMVVTESVFDNSTGRGHVEIIDQNASKQAVRSLNVTKTDKGYAIMKSDNQPVAGWFSVEKKQQLKQSPPPQSAPQRTIWQRVFNRAKNLLRNIF